MYEELDEASAGEVVAALADVAGKGPPIYQATLGTPQVNEWILAEASK